MNCKPHTALARINISLALMASTARMRNATVGKWRVTDRKSPVLGCSCGRKYIVTRSGQSTCLYCVWLKVEPADLRIFHKEE